MGDELPQGYATKLEGYRNASGLTIEEVAVRIGISVEAYRDLELHDDEIFKCVSLGQIALLSNTLRFDVRNFFSSTSSAPSESISLPQLAYAIQQYLRRQNKTPLEFEDSVGWGLGNALGEPSLFLGFNLTALMDICKELEIEWLSVLASVSTK